MKLKIGDAEIEIKRDMLVSKDLKKPCPYCDNDDCYMDCDESLDNMQGLESSDSMTERRLHNARIDGVEALLLALSKDYDVSEQKFQRAIAEALEAIE